MPDTMMVEAAAEDNSPTRSAEIDKLATALAKAQGEIEGAVKDRDNPAFRSKYADLGAVWDAIRQPFSKNGLSVVQFPRSISGGVEVETILMHASGQWMSGVFSVPASKQDAHGYGSATTYARRFSLSAVCGVAPVDDDGAAASSGMAGSGGDFRPAGPRKGVMAAATNSIKEARADIERNGPGPATKATTPPAGDAVKLVERSKKAIAYFKDDATTPEAAKAYWTEREDPIAEIEAAMPQEYERMLDAYNVCLERKPARVA